MNDDAPRFFDALARLNEIGSAINNISTGDDVSIDETLQLIVDSATEVSSSASAMLYTYDAKHQRFHTGSRVWSPVRDSPASRWHRPGPYDLVPPAGPVVVAVDAGT